MAILIDLGYGSVLPDDYLSFHSGFEPNMPTDRKAKRHTIGKIEPENECVIRDLDLLFQFEEDRLLPFFL